MDQPDVLDRAGIRPARERMAATTGRQARLIDPWIELASAMSDDQRTILEPVALTSYARPAIARFDEAAKDETIRAEAMVRKAWLLIRLDRPADGLEALAAVGDAAGVGDTAVRYWAHMVRGRALEKLGQTDAAAREYAEALTVVPGAQSGFAALTALEIGRGNYELAFRHAAEGRSVRPGATDPWRQYGGADFRFLDARLARLRELSR
jgi:hypothetical protein